MKDATLIRFHEFAKHQNIRLGSYYQLPKLKYDYRPFMEVISSYESGSRPVGGINPTDQGQAISLGGEQIGEDGELCLNKIPYVSYEYYDSAKKGKVKDKDILICKDGALTGKVCMVDSSLLPNPAVMVNEHVYIIRGNEMINQTFLFLIMRMELFRKQVIDYAYKKKGQPGLNTDHLYSLLIPDIPLSIQEAILEEIKPNTDRIKLLQNHQRSIGDIIDDCFEKEFSFDYEQFRRLHKVHTNTLPFTCFSNNIDLRFSAKFHRIAGTFVMKQLTERTSKRIKDFLAEPIVLGASISPSNYSLDEEYYYVSMATIKDWVFDVSSANSVSKEFYFMNNEKTIRKDDIIIARSGEGTIGKVALIDSDAIKGVFADFTMRVRLKKYNPEFAYYYFRTCYFQYLVEVYKKGLGNNTNIFPSIIQEFPIIDIPLDYQKQIVEEIHQEIEKQNAIKTKIAQLHEEIDTIVENRIVK